MKLPPFGAALNQLLIRGDKPKNDIYFFCGFSAWKKASYFSRYRYCLCLPPYEDPAIYRWPVLGCEILLFETGYLETGCIEEIVFHLLNSGAFIVRAVNFDYEIAIFRGEAV